MLALVKEKPEPGLWLRQVPVPVPGKNDVLIKIRKTSICGTDVHIYKWDEWARQTIPVGITIGHEFVGEIVELGENVVGFERGERVSGEGHIVCGACRNCLAGRRHLCKNTSGIGVNRNGAFAEYLAMPATNVWHCSPDIDDDVISCFDPLGNATHTALTYDVVGEDVLITGAGPIGIMATAICRHVGARHVVVTDINEYRLSLAARMGATRVVNTGRTNLNSVMAELQMKEGFDVGLEMSGNPDAFRDMIQAMYHGGKIALLGIPKEGTLIDWNKVVFNGLTIKGIYGREMYETWYKMSTMLQSGLDITPVITHRLPVEEFEQGFATMISGQSGKIVLDWSTIGKTSAKK
ncbi:MAG: L-threonine 3-dehydrogenase [Clostridiaceae bacterium]|nr:L-threonine 3-dehydrogenase [Clostridiaceae bacterium]